MVHSKLLIGAILILAVVLPFCGPGRRFIRRLSTWLLWGLFAISVSAGVVVLTEDRRGVSGDLVVILLGAFAVYVGLVARSLRSSR